MAAISIHNVTKRYGAAYPVLHEISLEIKDGEFLVLVGPSGCGKSTLLRMVAGLDTISEGEIEVDGKVVNDLPPKDRDMAMIFQTYALFPHMDVAHNLGFGLKLRGTPKAEAAQRIEAAARTLGLTQYLGRYPAQLSGGQRQRVAIGRALVRQPAVFLMDEPLANLDTKLRVHMRTEFARLREQLKTTTIYVTHDQTEAMTLGHRVCVLRDGKIQQVDTPDALFATPCNIFVAGFIGSPEMNFGLGRLVGGAVHLGEMRLPVPPDRDLSAYQEREVIVGIRPSDFHIADEAAGEAVLEVEVELVERLGSEVIVVFGVKTPRIRADRFGSVAADDDDEAAGLGQRAPDQGTFAARLDGAAPVAPGQLARLAVRPSALYFFDPQSGVAIGR